MNHALEVLALSLLAGLTIPLGGLLAKVEHIQPRWLERELRHTVIAFAGGALLSAVALFVPESIALGAIFAFDPARGRLLAFLIGLQNLPEGFNAFREMVSPGRMRAPAVLRFFLLLSLLGPLAAAIGLAFFPERSVVFGLVMVFAAGGILYLIFQDMAPAVALENQRTPALGAVAGFLLGLVEQMLAAG